MRISWTFSGIKPKAKAFAHIKGLPYRDAEVLSHLVYCLRAAVINAAPRIGKN